MRSKIKNLTDKSNSILLLTHENPDGDAVGSVLAFYHYLKSINKSVDMVILEVPSVFNFLPSIDSIVDDTDKEYDLGIVLDCTSDMRIGQKNDLFSKCRNTVSIDHHISNMNYADINLIEGNVSSCCQVVYYLLKDWNVTINKEIGESIMCGVITDTNGFGNNNVDSDTFRLASELSDLGIDIHNIYNRVICMKSMAKHQLMNIAMNRLEFLCDGKIAYTYILNDDFKQVGAVKGDHEGIVNIGRNIDGVLVSVFMREDDGWTISLRSTGSVDVNKIALSFGGGGHFMASGAKLDGSLEETKNKIIDEIKKVL